MDLREYWLAASKDERQAFADALGCTVQVVWRAYMPAKPEDRRRPSNTRIALMVKASGGKQSLESLMEYFVGQEARTELKKIGA